MTALTFELAMMLDRVAAECAVTRAQILSSKRRHRTTKASDARAIAVFVARELWGSSYRELRPVFRMRHHSGLLRLRNRVNFDPRMREIAERVIRAERQ